MDPLGNSASIRNSLELKPVDKLASLTSMPTHLLSSWLWPFQLEEKPHFPTRSKWEHQGPGAQWWGVDVCFPLQAPALLRCQLSKQDKKPWHFSSQQTLQEAKSSWPVWLELLWQWQAIVSSLLSSKNREKREFATGIYGGNVLGM